MNFLSAQIEDEILSGIISKTPFLSLEVAISYQRLKSFDALLDCLSIAAREKKPLHQIVEGYESNGCVKNVSYKLRYSIPYFFDSDDLLQTGYEAFLMAEMARKTRANITNFEGYIYKCIEYQIRKEVGRQKLITRICIDDIPPILMASG